MYGEKFENRAKEGGFLMNDVTIVLTQQYRMSLTILNYMRVTPAFWDSLSSPMLIFGSVCKHC